MTIQTKYNIGDEVWCVVSGKAVTAKVVKLTCTTISWGTSIKYVVDHRDLEYKENELASTKEELLKML